MLSLDGICEFLPGLRDAPCKSKDEFFYHISCNLFYMGTQASGIIWYQVVSMYKTTIITRDTYKVNFRTPYRHNAARYPLLLPSPGVFYPNWLIQIKHSPPGVESIPI